MTDRSPYSRVYWTIRNDERLQSIYPDDRHLATWLRLLLAADMAWPAPADLPASVRRSSLTALEAAGVLEVMPGGLFRFHGLDAERGRRREAAAFSAAHRTGSERVPNADRKGTERSASRAEPSRDKDEPSRADAGEADALDRYYALTLRYPSGKVKDWLSELASEFGHREAGDALTAEYAASDDLRTLLSRTAARLQSIAHHAELERARPKPRPRPTAEEVAKQERERADLIREWTRQVKEVPA